MAQSHALSLTLFWLYQTWLWLKVALFFSARGENTQLVLSIKDRPSVKRIVGGSGAGCPGLAQVFIPQWAARSRATGK